MSLVPRVNFALHSLMKVQISQQPARLIVPRNSLLYLAALIAQARLISLPISTAYMDVHKHKDLSRWKNWFLENPRLYGRSNRPHSLRMLNFLLI